MRKEYPDKLNVSCSFKILLFIVGACLLAEISANLDSETADSNSIEDQDFNNSHDMSSGKYDGATMTFDNDQSAEYDDCQKKIKDHCWRMGGYVRDCILYGTRACYLQ